MNANEGVSSLNWFDEGVGELVDPIYEGFGNLL
jgi:hypothetical protein